MQSTHKVIAEVTGTVWKIPVQEGDTVAQGGVVAILESMKMEVGCEAPASGVITSIAVREGASLSQGDLVMEIAAEGKTDA